MLTYSVNYTSATIYASFLVTVTKGSCSISLVETTWCQYPLKNE